MENSARRSGDTADGELSLRSLVESVWSYRRIWAITMFIGLAVAVLLWLVRESKYTARVTMLPHSETSDFGVLGKLATFAGTPLGGDDSYEGLYLEILRSDRLVREVMDRTWDVSAPGQQQDLYSFFGVDKQDPAQVEQFHARFRTEVVHFYRDRLNGFMVLKVTVPRDPTLAAEVANFLVDRLDSHNRHFRAERATRQREFVESRLANVEVELRRAEQARADFVSSNRGYGASPNLVRQFGEIEREVQAQTAVWVELRRQVEMAKLDENKQLVYVDVLDPATPPVRPVGAGLVRVALAGLILGLGAGLGAAAVRAQWRRA